MSSYISRPTRGIPQVSPISVQLWHVFFNDIPSEDDDNIYMNDWCLAIGAESYELAEEEANERLQHVHLWGVENKMTFDYVKSKAITLHDDCEVQLYLGSAVLEQVGMIKYLGCTIASRSESIFPRSSFGFIYQLEANIREAAQQVHR